MMRTTKFRLILVALLVFFVPSCLGFDFGQMSFVAMLCGGWIKYIARVVPQVHVNRAGVLSAVLCLLAVIFFAHIVGKWLWTESGATSRAGRSWQLRWTLMGVAIVVLMFTAGLAATGITHQSIWLARSDQPMFTDRWHTRGLRIRCLSDMRIIGQAIQEFAKHHDGALPDSLAPLSEYVGPESLKCYTGGEYVYNGAGLKLPVDPSFPLLCEPLANHNGEGMNILFGDLAPRWVPADEAARVMNRLSSPR